MLRTPEMRGRGEMESNTVSPENELPASKRKWDGRFREKTGGRLSMEEDYIFPKTKREGERDALSCSLEGTR